MKGMITSLEILIDEWKQKRSNFEEVKKMMKNSRFQFIFSKFDAIVGNLYYYLCLDSSNLLIQQIGTSNLVLNNLVRGGISIMVIGGLFWIWFLNRKISKAVFGFFLIRKSSFYGDLPCRIVYPEKKRQTHYLVWYLLFIDLLSNLFGR